MTRQEALDKIEAHLRASAGEDYMDIADDLLALIEDQEDGIGMYPPLTKKGLYKWDDDDEEEK